MLYQSTFTTWRVLRVQGLSDLTSGVVFDTEHRAGCGWFLRARAHYLRGPCWWDFWWGGWGSPIGPKSIIKTQLASSSSPLPHQTTKSQRSGMRVCVGFSYLASSYDDSNAMVMIGNAARLGAIKLLSCMHGIMTNCQYYGIGPTW